MEFAREFDRALELRSRIIALEPRMLAVEHCRAQHFIAVPGIFVAQLADMIGDAENLLHQHQPAASLPFRPRMIDGDPGALVHRHPDHLAPGPYPSRSEARRVGKGWGSQCRTR